VVLSRLDRIDGQKRREKALGDGWADWVSAGSSAVTAIVTLFLAFSGVRQLTLIREQLAQDRELKKAEFEYQRIAMTIAACNAYDTDPIFEEASKRVYVHKKNGYQDADPRDIQLVLNFLEGIAVGILQGIYIENIVKDQMEPVFIAAYNNFLAPTPDRAKEYTALPQIYQRWRPTPGPAFSNTNLPLQQ
jgi:hypothetical protein